jgi:hypothetical protein
MHIYNLFNMFMLMHVHDQHDLNDRNAFREKRLVRRILLLRNMEEGLDHWTTGPLVPLTEFVLTLWIERAVEKPLLNT